MCRYDSVISYTSSIIKRLVVCTENIPFSRRWLNFTPPSDSSEGERYCSPKTTDQDAYAIIGELLCYSSYSYLTDYTNIRFSQL